MAGTKDAPRVDCLQPLMHSCCAGGRWTMSILHDDVGGSANKCKQSRATPRNLRHTHPHAPPDRHRLSSTPLHRCEHQTFYPHDTSSPLSILEDPDILVCSSLWRSKHSITSGTSLSIWATVLKRSSSSLATMAPAPVRRRKSSSVLSALVSSPPLFCLCSDSPKASHRWRWGLWKDIVTVS